MLILVVLVAVSSTCVIKTGEGGWLKIKRGNGFRQHPAVLSREGTVLGKESFSSEAYDFKKL